MSSFLCRVLSYAKPTSFVPSVGLNRILESFPFVTPSRTKYTDWRMLRDAKRRKVVKEFAELRLQINALRHNDILPKKLQEIADAEIHALPKNSCFTRLHARCVLTSRARGRYKKYRMSRIIWRHLADYNLLSGVERAMW